MQHPRSPGELELLATKGDKTTPALQRASASCGPGRDILRTHYARPGWRRQGGVERRRNLVRLCNRLTSSYAGWFGRGVLAACALVILGTLATPLSAQVLYGSIVGVVLDDQGSAIPAATITVLNKDTNLSQETVSSANGEYTL